MDKSKQTLKGTMDASFAHMFELKQKIKHGGFTLIELLVVISIISVLSSTALVTLSTARTKARYASIILELRTMETAVEMYYQNNGNYGPEVPLVNGTLDCETPNTMFSNYEIKIIADSILKKLTNDWKLQCTVAINLFGIGTFAFGLNTYDDWDKYPSLCIDRRGVTRDSYLRYGLNSDGSGNLADCFP